jgi:hypothetical protein
VDSISSLDAGRFTAEQHSSFFSTDDALEARSSFRHTVVRGNVSTNRNLFRITKNELSFTPPRAPLDRIDAYRKEMAHIDIEFCKGYVDSNREIASEFAMQAERLITKAQDEADIDRRIELAERSEIFAKIARNHSAIADRQEQDLGIKCHCPFPPR